MDGAFFETWVVAEIYKSYLNVGKQPPLYFYRDSNKKEINLLIYQDGTITPIEIKKGSAHLKTKIGTGAVVCLPADMIPIDEKNWYIPAWLI